jgi:uncharacterized membrane protein YciS (DUF1049 family)
MWYYSTLDLVTGLFITFACGLIVGGLLAADWYAESRVRSNQSLRNDGE